MAGWGAIFGAQLGAGGGAVSCSLPYSARQIAALRTLIATWIGLAIFEALSQQPDVDQRLWLVVDELDALGAIDGLKDALARLRKYGGSLRAGLPVGCASVRNVRRRRRTDPD